MNQSDFFVTFAVFLETFPVKLEDLVLALVLVLVASHVVVMVSVGVLVNLVIVLVVFVVFPVQQTRPNLVCLVGCV